MISHCFFPLLFPIAFVEMKLTLVISSLGCGGAERVISIMANYWAIQGWEITLLTFDNGTIPPFYELNSQVIHQSLGIASDYPNKVAAIWNNFQRIRKLRSAIAVSQPDVIVSFIDQVNILTLLAVSFPTFLRRKNTSGLIQKLPVVVAERIDPSKYNIGRIWSFLREQLYPFANRIIVQTHDSLAQFPLQIQLKGNVIPNPVLPPPPEIFVAKVLDDKTTSLIAIGRLSQQKRHDLLLQAFACLRDRYPTWTLTILGEGVLRPKLEILRDSLGLSNRVHFLGAVKHPYTLLRQANIFVMSSEFEGFPNALCEAMACGLPVIATDCPSGPREIIRQGIDGILVPNKDRDALAAAMDRLMSDPIERERLAARAPEVVERFSLEKVMQMWETLLEQANRQ